MLVRRWEACFMNVLVVDVGGTHVKVLATGQHEPRKFPLRADDDGQADGRPASRGSPRAGNMTWCRSAIRAWFRSDRVVAEPHNLGAGWVGFDFEAAFGCPVKLINDAAMQAWEATKAGRCSFWAWEPASARP